MISSAEAAAARPPNGSDDHLIFRLRSGDEFGFAALVARYQPELLCFCRRMLGSREDAEDVVQETFAAAYKAILGDQRSIRCRPWLYEIARNRCLNELRRRRPTEPPPDGVTTIGIAEHVERRIQLRLLLGDIHELPCQQREALVLYELEGCSYKDIAGYLGSSTASVRSLLLRARRTLSAIEAARAA